MHVSEARLAANKLNGSKSRGPLSPETRAISARNSLKHGLTGNGVVVPEGDAEEIARRVEALTLDMKPNTPAGAILIVQMATLSVRFERAADQETAALAHRVRHAADDFDEERFERAEQLVRALADDPRGNLRKLKKMPEGVELLIDAWLELRSDLTLEPEPDWTPEHFERAAHLLGLKARQARGSHLGALSRGVMGDFASLHVDEGGDLDEESRREWCKGQLVEAIDAEIAALEAHYETLDFETLAIDRAEAGKRALFDPSKPACLARRYESEANRGFFKALKEFRKVEAESEARAEVAPARPTAPPEPRMGSFRETDPSLGRELARAFPEALPADFTVARGAEGQPLSIGRPSQPPR